jgi:hypothetical protein
VGILIVGPELEIYFASFFHATYPEFPASLTASLPGLEWLEYESGIDSQACTWHGQHITLNCLNDQALQLAEAAERWHNISVVNVQAHRSSSGIGMISILWAPYGKSVSCGHFATLCWASNVEHHHQPRVDALPAQVST